MNTVLRIPHRAPLCGETTIEITTAGDPAIAWTIEQMAGLGLDPHAALTIDEQLAERLPALGYRVASYSSVGNRHRATVRRIEARS